MVHLCRLSKAKTTACSLCMCGCVYAAARATTHHSNTSRPRRFSTRKRWRKHVTERKPTPPRLCTKRDKQDHSEIKTEKHASGARRPPSAERSSVSQIVCALGYCPSLAARHAFNSEASREKEIERKTADFSNTSLLFLVETVERFPPRLI